MTVYFSAKAQDILEKIEVYRLITRTVYEAGHVLTHSWIEPSWQRALRLEQQGIQWKPEDWESLCVHATMAIRHSDILIAEASGVSSFGVGYQIAEGLRLKKPILVLVEKDNGYGSYALGLINPLLQVYEYDKKTLVSAVRAFLKEQSVESGSAMLELPVDAKSNQRLKALAAATGKTENEIASDLIRNGLNR